MEKGKSYKLTVANVADEFGNVMTTTSRTVVGIAEDIAPPKVTKTVYVDKNTVQVFFDERLDDASANDPANYVVNNDIGTVTKAEVSSKLDYQRVTLTVPDLTANKSYTVTINNVKDRLNNAMTDVKAYFVATRTSVDTDKPEISAIDVLSENEVRVTFNEPVNATTPAMTVTYTGVNANANELEAVGALLDDGTTVVFKTDDTSAGAVWDLTANTEYTITALTGITDKSNNTYAIPTDKPTFYGSDSDNVRAEVSTIEQIDPKTIRVIFTKPVVVTGGDGSTTTWTSTAAVGTIRAYVDPDGDDTTESESTVDFVTSLAEWPYDVDVKCDLTTEIEDYMGYGVKDDEDTDTVFTKLTTFRTYIDDDDAPVIDIVEPLSKTKIKVVFNEDIMNTIAGYGTYKIVNEAGTTVATSVDPRRDADEHNIITFTTSATLTADTAYTLKPVVGAKDLAGNQAKVTDVEFYFIGSAVTTDDYISGVEIRNSNTIRVKTTMDLAAIAAADSFSVAELTEKAFVHG